MTPPIVQLHRLYDTANTSERYGQWFCNNYVKIEWPQLYYEENFARQVILICKWLAEHQYDQDLPMMVTPPLRNVNTK